MGTGMVGMGSNARARRRNEKQSRKWLNLVELWTYGSTNAGRCVHRSGDGSLRPSGNGGESLVHAKGAIDERSQAGIVGDEHHCSSSVGVGP
jgi:hypothetical protein